MNIHEQKRKLPLDGLVILAAEHMVAGPMATQLLADMGAEVIKIERPKVGESGRRGGPYLDDYDGSKTASTMYRVNRNKKSITLDLSSDKGKEVFKQLAENADVVVENFRAGVMEKLGLGYRDLSKINEKLVYVSLSGYGHKDILASPYKDWAAYGNIAESLAGITYNLNSRTKSDEAGGFHGLSLGDIFTGLNGVIGLLVALHDAKETGKGRYVDIAMMDSLFLLNERPMMNYFLTGVKPSPETNFLSFIVGDFKANDGYFTVSVFVESHWQSFCKIIEREDLLSNPEFDTPEKRGSQVESFFRPVLEDWASKYSKHQVASMFREAGIAAAPVLDPEDLEEDPHIQARKMLVEFPMGEGKTLKAVGNPIKMSELSEEGQQVRRPPKLGEHTGEVLRKYLDFAEADIKALEKENII
ncbi:CaiB/BaiF CoA transferase family protein [Salinibacillus xinjiangensis]|uniref:CoA transferase n=1 Tax=Salinibacillus xinjiangensis TaxID=1229268 RepID=A0A6G1X1R6_9BACI|nr:CaiB/BaiF CoA-transferase family protein [Salinibacillus xinjiangensis]MRG84882.1 CoA transferase [Salinibacillus xinjiangensis]